MVQTNCSVHGCNSTSKLNKELKFHRFPRDARCQLWVDACRRPDLRDKSVDQLYNKHVCSLHFEEWMYMRKKLKSAAIPVLNLPASSIHSMSTQTAVPKLEISKKLVHSLGVQQQTDTTTGFQPQEYSRGKKIPDPVLQIPKIINMGNKARLKRLKKREFRKIKLEGMANCRRVAAAQKLMQVNHCGHEVLNECSSSDIFPRDPNIKEKWINATGQKNWIPTKHSTICSSHFSEKDFDGTKKNKKLFPNSYPQIDVWGNNKKHDVPETSSSYIRKVSLSHENISVGPTQGPSGGKRISERAPDIPEGKVLIARVYRFLETEYEQLKEFTGNSVDLSPLANILQRTADATGVTQDTVTAILEEEKQSKDAKRPFVPKKRAKLRQESKLVSAIEDESARGQPDTVPAADDDGQQEQEGCEVVTMKVEVQEDENFRFQEQRDAAAVRVKMDPLLPCETSSANHHSLIPKPNAEVKAEIADDEPQQCAQRVTCDTSYHHHPVTVKCEPAESEVDDMEVCSNNTISDPLHAPDVFVPPEHGVIAPTCTYIYATSPDS